ncbi:transcription factor bHLH110 isoform X2 [Hevea brasiliensis]|uniref:transcription factor bHLH110 isoform X2 n=1 Tax=Hevea brasiliensis TaxID=3981 RepID=UPI0025F08B5B|nr:transcription factor bHLH110 isoform X2 [Hevea brasiliensis]
MESANLHHQHHQLQGQLVGSSSLTAPSGDGAGSPHAWTQNITLSSGNFNPNCNGVSLNPRQKNEFLIPPLNSSMIQDLGFPWNSNAGCFTNQSAHDLQLVKIKQELSESFPKFTEMLNNPSTVEDSHLSSTSYIKDEEKDMTDLSEKLLLKTISSGFPINGHQFSPAQIYSTAHDCSNLGNSIPRRGNFSQIYPSINISNLNRSTPSISGSFDMNLQALDLLNSTRFSRSFGEPSHDNLGIYKDSISYGPDRMQMPSCSPSKASSFTTNKISEAKRPSNSLMEPKATQAVTKKSRLESRASCPPFKVRKEKLGDRIAALQQLVAPFGKTDTASVLMEAIGYIKFLQNQVETLSVPYMKSSRNKTSTRTTQAGLTMEEGYPDEPRKDLRSRGLCLVPLSCMSYVTGDGGGEGGGGIWPPPNFGGGT